MSKFIKYIKRYWRSTKSLAGGLKTSIKVFFRKKVTEQYPENRHTTLYIPERHRAQLEMIHNDQNQHHCVACGLCQMACPNDTIRVVSEVREDAEGKKKKFLVKYEYDLGAIRFSNDFENSVFERDKLLLTLNREGSVLAPASEKNKPIKA